VVPTAVGFNGIRFIKALKGASIVTGYNRGEERMPTKVSKGTEYLQGLAQAPG
jgi:hypothetical protein